MLNNQNELPPANIANLTNLQLEERLKLCVDKETAMTIQILHLLAEVENRRLYSHTHPSLFEYCVKVLKYSGGSAQRRIDSMRAMKLMPEIESKLQTGELQMVVVSQAQAFFRQEKKAGKPYDVEAKRQMLAKLENKSVRECEKELVAISPQSVRPDARREINPDRTELRITLDHQLVAKLDQLKALLSGKYPHLTDQELIAVLADIALKKLDPAQSRPATQSQSTTQSQPTTQNQSTTQNHPGKRSELLPPVEVLVVRKSPGSQNLGRSTKDGHTSTRPSRYIASAVKQEVWRRDKGRCTHSGCGSNHKLQLDHIVPVAKGGASTVQNLRILCEEHNLLAARMEFGDGLMSRYLDRKPAGSQRRHRPAPR